MGMYYGTNGNDVKHGSNDSDGIYVYEGDDVAYGYLGDDVIVGYGGHDTLYGMIGIDTLYGMDGNDYLSGGASSDYLYGDNGYDTLVGGAHADKLSGGLQADTFKFESVGDASGDRITDFNRWEGDKIDLGVIDAKEYSVFSSSTWGNNTFSFVGTNSFTGKGQVHYSHSGGNTYIQGNTDGDNSDAEFTITLSGTHNLQYSDFVL